MSSIIGLVKNNDIYMGCDSASVEESSGFLRNAINQKIFYAGNMNMLIGVAGSPRVLQVLENCFDFPEHPEGMSTKKYICSIWLNAMVECFEENNLKAADYHETVDGAIMIGYRSELFIVYSDLSITHGNNIDSIGCGSEYAIATAHSLFNLTTNSKYNVDISMTDIVYEALKVSAKYSMGVRGPYNIHVLKNDSQSTQYENIFLD